MARKPSAAERTVPMFPDAAERTVPMFPDAAERTVECRPRTPKWCPVDGERVWEFRLGRKVLATLTRDHGDQCWVAEVSGVVHTCNEMIEATRFCEMHVAGYRSPVKGPS